MVGSEPVEESVTTTMKTFVLCALLCGLCVSTPAAAASRPNILFLMSDDHALEAIGAYGSWLKDYVHTPTLDRLAEEGMRFTNVCCNNSICSPSRASIITGQYSHINGGLNLNCSVEADSPSYIIELQNAGYATAVVGKWHMSHWPRGCDDYAVTKGQGSYFNPTFNHPDGSQAKKEGYYADVYTDWALDWLKRKRDKVKPFCLNLQFKGPHHPYDYPERWAHLHEGVEIPEPESLHEDLEASSPLLKKPSWSQLYDGDAERPYYHRHESEYPRLSEDPKERRSISYQHMIHKYLRCVAAIDENIKRVLDYLEAEGLKDDTLMIYTSDQGYWLGQHGLYDKRLILEESLKMPLLVRYPKEIAAGNVNEKLAMNIDFGPTMLDFAGVPRPEAMQGVSLRPLLQGKAPADWRTGIFYAYYARTPYHWGIRNDRYKLVCFPGTDEIEFYDLKTDPFEMTNQSQNAEYATRIEATRAQLVSLMDEVGVTEEFLHAHMKSLKSTGGKKQPKKNRKAKEKKAL